MESLFRHAVCLTVVFVLISIVYVSPAQAQERDINLQKFTLESDAIVTGKVIDRKSEWSSDKSKIVTHVQIEVAEYLKGSEGRDIRVTHLGGEVGDVGEIYSHMPSFIDNEEVLLFVKRDSKDNFKVYGGEDGKLSITTLPGNSVKRVGDNQSLASMKNKIKDYLDAK